MCFTCVMLRESKAKSHTRPRHAKVLRVRERTGADMTGGVHSAKMELAHRHSAFAASGVIKEEDHGTYMKFLQWDTKVLRFFCVCDDPPPLTAFS